MEGWVEEAMGIVDFRFRSPDLQQFSEDHAVNLISSSLRDTDALGREVIWHRGGTLGVLDMDQPYAATRSLCQMPEFELHDIPRDHAIYILSSMLVHSVVFETRKRDIKATFSESQRSATLLLAAIVFANHLLAKHDFLLDTDQILVMIVLTAWSFVAVLCMKRLIRNLRYIKGRNGLPVSAAHVLSGRFRAAMVGVKSSDKGWVPSPGKAEAAAATARRKVKPKNFILILLGRSEVVVCGVDGDAIMSRGIFRYRDLGGSLGASPEFFEKVP